MFWQSGTFAVHTITTLGVGELVSQVTFLFSFHFFFKCKTQWAECFAMFPLPDCFSHHPYHSLTLLLSFASLGVRYPSLPDVFPLCAWHHLLLQPQASEVTLSGPAKRWTRGHHTHTNTMSLTLCVCVELTSISLLHWSTLCRRPEVCLFPLSFCLSPSLLCVELLIFLVWPC